MGEKDIELHERIASLEAKTELILTNHLPHIQIKLDEVDTRVWWILGTVVIGFLSSILVMLLK